MSRDHIDVLYLNVVVRNGKEAVKAKVEKSLSRFPKLVKTQAAQRASDLATPKMVAQHLSRKLRRKLPAKMGDLGVTIEVSEVFREGPFVVMQLQVIHVDTVALASKNPGDNGGQDPVSSMVQWFMDSIGANYQQTLEEDYLPKLVMKQLAVEMPSLLEEKMASKMVEAETKVLNAKREARYFFSKLKEVREQRETQKRKNPIRRVTKSLPFPNAAFLDYDSDSSAEDGQ